MSFDLITELDHSRHNLLECIALPQYFRPERPAVVFMFSNNVTELVPPVNFYDYGLIGVGEPNSFLLEQNQLMSLSNKILHDSSPLTDFERAILKKTLYMDALSIPTIQGMK